MIGQNVAFYDFFSALGMPRPHPNGAYRIDYHRIMLTLHATSLPPMHHQTQMIPIHKIKKSALSAGICVKLNYLQREIKSPSA